jgi:hypothetical protein
MPVGCVTFLGCDPAASRYVDKTQSSLVWGGPAGRAVIADFEAAIARLAQASPGRDPAAAGATLLGAAALKKETASDQSMRSVFGMLGRLLGISGGSDLSDGLEFST